ncbi:MAG: hypothetical protein KGZ93_08590 [Actinobacteria bacterium]|nr:hypothetical protein [Actinomycetota bacterium]
MKKLFLLVGLAVLSLALSTNVCLANERPLKELLKEQELEAHPEREAIEKLLADDSIKQEIAEALSKSGSPGEGFDRRF